MSFADLSPDGQGRNRRVLNWTSDLRGRAMIICALVGLVAAVVGLGQPAFLAHFVAAQDSALEDRFFIWRQAVGSALGYRAVATDDIVIVAVDNDSARHLGAYPPWPRQFFAHFLRKMKEAGARAIVFDLLFDGPSPLVLERGKSLPPRLASLLPADELKSWTSDPAFDDKAFCDELQKSSNVVLATDVEVAVGAQQGLGRVHYETPYEPFVYALRGDAGALGNRILESDRDGIVRQAVVSFSEFQHLLSFSHSLALRAVERAVGHRSVRSEQGDIFISTGHAFPGRFKINYAGPSGTFPVVPFWKTLEWEKHYGGAPATSESNAPSLYARNPFQEKIVIIGYHDYLPDDLQAPPGLQPRWGASAYHTFGTPIGGFTQPMSGVEVHANIIENLLHKRYLHEPTDLQIILIVAFVAVLFARVFGALTGRPWTMLVSVVAFACSWVGIAFLAFIHFDYLLPVSLPLLCIALPAWLFVLMDQNLLAFHERRRHTRIFRNLASKQLAGEIDRKQLGELGLEGKQITVTTLACQLEGFPDVTSDQSPAAVINLLNECLSAMIAAVCQHGGIVDRVYAYGVMALWGAPLAVPEATQAESAANCVLYLESTLTQLFERWQQEGKLPRVGEPLKVAFGISTGPAICGQIGSPHRTEYGAIGKSVDLALFLESANRELGTRILLSPATARLLSDKFELRELDKIASGDSRAPQLIYELLGEKNKLPGVIEEAALLYKQGRAALDQDNFAEAARQFASILRMMPDDRPSLRMLERCQEYLGDSSDQGKEGVALRSSTTPD